MPGKKKTDFERPEDTPGFGLRVGISIVSVFALAAFLVVWLFLFADKFTIYQNIGVLAAAVLVFAGVMGASWASWGIKYGKKFDKCCK